MCTGSDYMTCHVAWIDNKFKEKQQQKEACNNIKCNWSVLTVNVSIVIVNYNHIHNALY